MEDKIVQINPSRSVELKDLFGALAKAQGEMQTAGLTSDNPFFKSKYADLAEIVKCARPYLTKNGLCIVQQILPCESNNQNHVLHTVLGHASGQWIESRMRIAPVKQDIQSLGSHITYLRRYSLAALCGIVSSHEDDDGEAVMNQVRNFTNRPTNVQSREYPSQKELVVTKEQLEELEHELKDHTDLAFEIMEKMKIESLADIPKSRYMATIQRIREIKSAKQSVK